MIEKSLVSHQNLVKAKQITCLDDVVSYYHKHLAGSGWTLYLSGEVVYLLLIDVNGVSGPYIAASITIQADLGYIVKVMNNQLAMNKIPVKLHFLKSVDVLEALMNYVKCKRSELKISARNDDLMDKLSLLINASDNTETLEFIKEQLHLWRIPANSRRYHGHTLILACSPISIHFFVQ